MSDMTRAYMIGNSHIDPVWLWLWPEGVEATRATFRSALDRMKETPEFIFSGGQAAIYDWIEKTDPTMFSEIKERVAQGRWVIVNGWWMQPDCNIPSGESFIRQALYGQRYFMEKLGTKAEVAYNVDSFGHNGMLPQILTKCGFTSYVFMRPDRRENAKVPNLFMWKSPDGSEILTYKIPICYNLYEDSKEKMAKRMEEHVNHASNPSSSAMVFYGVGNHGGGPTKAQLAFIKELIAEGFTPSPSFSSPNEFFDDIRKAQSEGLELPTHASDMQHHASGCYSVHSEIKRNNRKSEAGLVAAEKLSTLAGAMTGYAYPTKALTQAWRGVLFNQFHDILAGTSFPDAYDDARNLHGLALQTAKETITYATQSIATKIDTSWHDGYETALVVFNPHSWPVAAPVEISYQFGINWRTLADEEGRLVETQLTSNRTTVTNRTVSTFVAEVPAMGYRTFRCLKAKSSVDSKGRSLKATVNTLENDWVRLELDESTGHISRLVDKKGNVDILSGCGAVPKVMDDPSDTWSHAVFSFRNHIGSFGSANLRLLEVGPLRACVRVESTYASSKLVQEFIMYRDLPWVEVRATVDWQETYKALKLCFPVNSPVTTATYEMPFGYIQKPANGEEEPMHAWVDATGTNEDGTVLGLAITNDSKYSCDVMQNEIGLTVLRSPAYAHHEPGVIEEGQDYIYIDQGKQTFSYRLAPHVGQLDAVSITKMATELNQPAIALVESNHPGTLPLTYSGLSISADNLSLSTIKRSEDGTGTVVRIYETKGQGCTAEVSLTALNTTWTATFDPHEVKTWMLPDSAPGQVIPCNMIEEQ